MSDVNETEENEDFEQETYPDDADLPEEIRGTPKGYVVDPNFRPDPTDSALIRKGGVVGQEYPQNSPIFRTEGTGYTPEGTSAVEEGEGDPEAPEDRAEDNVPEADNEQGTEVPENNTPVTDAPVEVENTPETPSGAPVVQGDLVGETPEENSENTPQQ